MVDFQEFTLEDGSKIVVNIRQIIFIKPNDKGSVIQVLSSDLNSSINFIHVKEDYERIKSLLSFLDDKRLQIKSK